MSIPGCQISDDPNHPDDFSKLCQLDQRTNDIVYGYIHQHHNDDNGVNDDNDVRHIASIILNFIFSYFMMGYGKFTWQIYTADIKSYKNGQKKASQVFVIGKLNWKIEAYPNGYHKDSIGSFKLYVKLLDLPDTWSNVVVCRTTECIESYSKVTNICTYKKQESYGWTTGCLTIDEITPKKILYNGKMKGGYKRLTFIITIRILQINLINQINQKLSPIPYYQFKLEEYRKEYNPLKWTLSDKLIKKMKTANVGKKFESEIYDDIWCIQCCPNGRNAKSQGEVRIYLQLCALPKNISSICIQYRITCKQIGICSKGEKTLSYMSTWVKTENKIVSFNTFKSQKRIDIIVSIKILKEIGFNGQNVTMEQTANEWNQLIEEEQFKERSQSEKLNLQIYSNNNLNGLKQKIEENEKRLNLLTKQLQTSEETMDKLTIKMESEKIIKNNKKKYENKNEYENINSRLDEMNKTMANLMNQMQQIITQNHSIKKLNQNETSDNENTYSTDEKVDTVLAKKKQDVKIWLNRIGYEEYFDCFIDHGFDDLEIVKYLTKKELNKMKGITNDGHRIKILTYVDKLNCNVIK